VPGAGDATYRPRLNDASDTAPGEQKNKKMTKGKKNKNKKKKKKREEL